MDKNGLLGAPIEVTDANTRCQYDEKYFSKVPELEVVGARNCHSADYSFRMATACRMAPSLCVGGRRYSHSACLS